MLETCQSGRNRGLTFQTRTQSAGAGEKCQICSWTVNTMRGGEGGRGMESERGRASQNSSEESGGPGVVSGC